MFLQKLKISSDHRLRIINAPDGFIDNLKDEKPDLSINGNHSKYDAVILFVKSRKELKESFPGTEKIIENDGTFWIAYPKKSSKIQSDLLMTSDWDVLDKHNYRIVSAASIDGTWTALRVRSKDLVKTKKSGTINPEEEKHIDRVKRIVTLPEDMEKELQRNKKALEKFNSMSFTHRKEYVLWIIEAKKPETREKRLKELAAKILN